MRRLCAARALLYVSTRTPAGPCLPFGVRVPRARDYVHVPAQGFLHRPGLVPLKPCEPARLAPAARAAQVHDALQAQPHPAAEARHLGLRCGELRRRAQRCLVLRADPVPRANVRTSRGPGARSNGTACALTRRAQRPRNTPLRHGRRWPRCTAARFSRSAEQASGTRQVAARSVLRRGCAGRTRPRDALALNRTHAALLCRLVRDAAAAAPGRGVGRHHRAALARDSLPRALAGTFDSLPGLAPRFEIRGVGQHNLVRALAADRAAHADHLPRHARVPQAPAPRAHRDSAPGPRGHLRRARGVGPARGRQPEYVERGDHLLAAKMPGRGSPPVQLVAAARGVARPFALRHVHLRVGRHAHLPGGREPGVRHLSARHTQRALGDVAVCLPVRCHVAGVRDQHRTRAARRGAGKHAGRDARGYPRAAPRAGCRDRRVQGGHGQRARRREGACGAGGN
mmetsp:Transcript_43402/g.107266  ORF Transcript_43402/g.107266 Transcript_43402/m.107266 type:complete len:456 (+) Transcript_43402:609-1976(+)